MKSILQMKQRGSEKLNDVFKVLCSRLPGLLAMAQPSVSWLSWASFIGTTDLWINFKIGLLE